MPEIRELPRLAWRGVLLELRLYWNLLRWLARHPDHGRAGEEQFGYARLVAPVMGLWIFASAAEVPLIHILVPWDSVRIPLLALGVWGLIWMLGVLASLYVRPHLLGREALRVRYGALADIAVPWADIASIAIQRRDLPSSIRTLRQVQTDQGVELQVAVSDQVNVRVVLRQPTAVPARHGRSLEITALSFYADDAAALVQRARELLAAAGSRPASGR